MPPDFDSSRFDENQKRIVTTRKMLKVPQQVQDFVVQLLTFTGKRSDWYRTCITCSHWDKEAQRCKLFNALPPAEVIADGCEKYDDYDGIPF
jgi:hypothetical protein